MKQVQKRPVGEAIWDGFKRKCPNCHEGALFDGYLKVSDYCPNCDEDFTHQRADDGPAWATMLIVMHLIPPVVMGVYESFDNPAPWKVALFMLPLFTLITLLVLPRIKGIFVCIQWANRMHGFGKTSESTPNSKPTPLSDL